jgi:hypothetical protein
MDNCKIEMHSICLINVWLDISSSQYFVFKDDKYVVNYQELQIIDFLNVFIFLQVGSWLEFTFSR